MRLILPIQREGQLEHFGGKNRKKLNGGTPNARPHLLITSQVVLQRVGL